MRWCPSFSTASSGDQALIIQRLVMRLKVTWNKRAHRSMSCLVTDDVTTYKENMNKIITTPFGFLLIWEVYWSRSYRIRAHMNTTFTWTPHSYSWGSDSKRPGHDTMVCCPTGNFPIFPRCGDSPSERESRTCFLCRLRHVPNLDL